MSETMSETMSGRKITFVKRLAVVLVALLLVFTITMAVSPTARAAALDIVQNIGGLIFNEVEHMEEADLPPGAIGSYSLYTHQSLEEAGITTRSYESYDVADLDEVREKLGFEFGIPGWTPDGFTLNNEIRYLAPDGEVFQVGIAWLRWENPAGEAVIDLNIQYPAQDNVQHIVGQGGVEEIQVNGQPAALQRGLWNADTREWVETSLIVLSWSREGAVYTLSADSTIVSLEALVQMAEAIP